MVNVIVDAAPPHARIALGVSPAAARTIAEEAGLSWIQLRFVDDLLAHGAPGESGSWRIHNDLRRPGGRGGRQGTVAIRVAV